MSALFAVAALVVLTAGPARADNPFLSSYRFRLQEGHESGARVAERVRARSPESGVFGHGRGERRVSMAPADWSPSPVEEDRQCARYCLAGAVGNGLSAGSEPIPTRRVQALFKDLLDLRGSGVDDGTWFWDGRGARRFAGSAVASGTKAEPRTYFWDGASAVRGVGEGTASNWEPGSRSGRVAAGADLPQEEVFYWHGPDQSEVVRTTEFGLGAIAGGAPAWFVSTAGYWEVHSWSGSSSYQVTADTTHQWFFTHGDRTLTMMDGLSGNWEDDVSQLVDPSQWLLYLVRNREALQAMEAGEDRDPR